MQKTQFACLGYVKLGHAEDGSTTKRKLKCTEGEILADKLRSLKQFKNPYDSYWERDMHRITEYEIESNNRLVERAIEIVRKHFREKEEERKNL